MRSRHSQKGIIIVVVLFIVIILSLTVSITGRNGRMDTKLRTISSDVLECRWALKAGMATAFAVLNEDEPDSDGLQDLWSFNPEDLNNVQLADCLLDIKVIDEASKLNVNSVTAEQLMILDNMTQEIAEAIVDWRDENNEPSEQGTEIEYYQSLKFKYQPRNAAFKTIRELLLVKGVTKDLFYGEDTNCNGLLDLNEKDGAASLPNDNGDDVLNKGWVDYLTCYWSPVNTDAEGNQKIDINSAEQDELKDSLSLNDSQAGWVVANRPFANIGELMGKQSNNNNSGNGNSQNNNRSRNNNRNQNQNQSRNQQQNNNNNDQSEPLDKGTFQKVADKVTVGDAGIPQVNINTASAMVLAGIIGGTEDDYQLANSIVTYRDTLGAAVTSIGDLLDISGMDIDEFKKIAGFITVRSNVYSVCCYARIEQAGIVRTSMYSDAVVERAEDDCKILYSYFGNTN